MTRRRTRYVNILNHARITRPDIVDPSAAIAATRLIVDGRIVMSTLALVPSTAQVVLRPSRRLRGEAKLRAALDAFGVEVAGRICLDVGAAAGGFTRVLLERGAASVFAVDAGYGQLRGSLRAHARVIVLERINLSDLGEAMPRSRDLELVTMDLSYLSVTTAVPQLEAVRLSASADLIALVKPMYELGLAAPPTDERRLRNGLERACRGVERDQRWVVEGTMPSPVPGARGTREWLLRAHRANTPDRPSRAADRPTRRRGAPRMVTDP
jgi:23S rRNA (cytidine1920-2'-O)/16S rRNA (cytidine1409-2'-O)-methyltransferase